jgi:NAD(P)-dependent dehydrogenase (short-subunit alcohol dehydrogenase family)
LLENAGIVASGFSLANGHERMVTLNVISTMYLALLLLPKLKASAKQFNTTPRLVIVSSEVHAYMQFPQWKESSVCKAHTDESNFNADEGYPVSKLLEVLIVREIAPKLEGSRIIINVLNPVLCHSGLNRDWSWALAVMKVFFARATEVGLLLLRVLHGRSCMGSTWRMERWVTQLCRSLREARRGKKRGRRCGGS